MKKLEAVPARNRFEELFGEISDGGVWELDESDVERTGYASLESLYSSAKFWMAKHGYQPDQYTLSYRRGNIVFQLHQTNDNP